MIFLFNGMHHNVTFNINNRNSLHDLEESVKNTQLHAPSAILC